jgi:UDP-N-acetyl-2-amino-2-deoxyglucuronate dehydrogenase
MKKELGFCVAGSGMIASVHADAILGTPGAGLRAFYARNGEKAGKLAEKYGVMYYTDYEEMLKNADIDCVSICTPSGTHAKLGIDAARSGKHVIVEKPIDVNLKAARDLIDECRKNNVTLGSIFQMRFNRKSQEAKEIIESGRLGKLILGDAYMKFYRKPEYYSSSNWKGTLELDGGAALINQGIHGVDLLQWLMGPVDSVFAVCKTLRHNIEGEDTVTAVLNFKNGASGVIESTTSVYPDRQQEIHIYGTQGTLVLAGTEVTYIKQFELMDGTKYTGEEVHGEDDALGEPHRLQYVDFIKAVTEGREPLINGEEGMKALEIVRAVYASSASGKPVRLPLEE